MSNQNNQTILHKALPRKMLKSTNEPFTLPRDGKPIIVPLDMTGDIQSDLIDGILDICTKAFLRPYNADTFLIVKRKARDSLIKINLGMNIAGLVKKCDVNPIFISYMTHQNPIKCRIYSVIDGIMIGTDYNDMSNGKIRFIIKIDQHRELMIKLFAEGNAINSMKVILCSSHYESKFQLKEEKTDKKPKTHGISFLEK